MERIADSEVAAMLAEREVLLAEHEALLAENSKLRQWARQAAEALREHSRAFSKPSTRERAGVDAASAEPDALGAALDELRRLTRQVETQAALCARLASDMAVDVDGLSSGQLFGALARKLDRLEGQSSSDSKPDHPTRAPRRPTKLPPRDATVATSDADTPRVEQLV